MERQKSFPRLPELDGLRGLAALAVFANHFFGVQVRRMDRVADMPAALRVFEWVGRCGYLGVDVFFCLSGFLITSLLLVDRENPYYFHNFYWKRALRILPVYLVHLGVIAALVPFKAAWPYLALSLLFVVNFLNLFRLRPVGPAWTLSIEEQFYLVWPRVIRRLSLEAVYYVAFGLIALSTLSRLVVTLMHHSAVMQYTFFRCDGLALGAVLACQWFSTEGRSRTVRVVLAGLNSNWTLAAVAAVAVVALSPYGEGRLRPQILTSVTCYGVYRLMRFIVAYRVRGGDVWGKGAFSWLGSPVAVYFGAISYALYLYQSSVILEMNFHLGHIAMQDGWGFLRRAVLDLTVCVVVCTVSRYAMELPVQRLRRHVLLPRRM